MVDAADREKMEASRNELHNLLDKPQLQGIPVRGNLWSLAPQKTLMISEKSHEADHKWRLNS